MTTDKELSCGKCGNDLVLIEKDTMLGDKYACKNESCIRYVEEKPHSEDDQ